MSPASSSIQTRSLRWERWWTSQGQALERASRVRYCNNPASRLLLRMLTHAGSI